MTGFNSIIGQRLPVRLLQTFRLRGAVPHALLFTGMAGVGKRTVARTFAMALNCRAENSAAAARGQTAEAPDGKPCGACRTCRQILAGNHPDSITIAPQGGILRIDQIRRLIAVLAMKPFDQGCRVALIADAHLLNPEASNALLKVLEEPPANTILILTALQQSALLPTIVSRCRHIRFNPLPIAELTRYLTQQRGIDGELARAVAELSGGSVSEASKLIENAWQTNRDWLVRAAGLDAIDQGRTAADALMFAAALTARKESIQDDLTLIRSWIRDLWILPHASRLVTHQDCMDRLGRVRARIGPERLRLTWETIEKAQKDIAANANLRLTLDVMALKMAGLTCQTNFKNRAQAPTS